MKELIGKTIRQILVSNDQQILVFFCDYRNFVAYEADGDCCSESWFADITGVEALIHCKVESVEEMPMEGYNVEDGRCRQDSDEAYGYKIKTNRGYADIVFRNSSNGYYGGTLIPWDFDFMREEVRTSKDFEEIKKDWQALAVVRED